MSWDYGQDNQTAAEYDDAMKRGLCPRCAVHRPAENHSICDVCEREEETAKYEDARYDTLDDLDLQRKLEEFADADFDHKLERAFWDKQMEADDSRDEIV